MTSRSLTQRDASEPPASEQSVTPPWRVGASCITAAPVTSYSTAQRDASVQPPAGHHSSQATVTRTTGRQQHAVAAATKITGPLDNAPATATSAIGGREGSEGGKPADTSFDALSDPTPTPEPAVAAPRAAHVRAATRAPQQVFKTSSHPLGQTGDPIVDKFMKDMMAMFRISNKDTSGSVRSSSLSPAATEFAPSDRSLSGSHR